MHVTGDFELAIPDFQSVCLLVISQWLRHVHFYDVVGSMHLRQPGMMRSVRTYVSCAYGFTGQRDS